MPRSRLGPLAIETPLGSNPTSKDARVWRAVHVSLRKSVAVRVFHVAFGGTLESRTQFAEEWARLKKLDHPAICKCYGGGFEDSEAYLAHELIEGPTLADEIAKRGRLPWESVLDFAEPITDALHYLHTRGIVHGRLGADKIIIAGLSPVLVDVRAEDGSAPFRDGPYHFQRPPSPEQLKRRPPEAPGLHDQVTARSDLYMLGALLYEALTGAPPISGSTIQETTANLEYQTPTSVASTVMDTPVWMDRLVMQLLSKDPAGRPVSAEAVKLQLGEVRRRAMSRSGVAEHASSGFSPLAVTNQADREEARVLLGKHASTEPAKQVIDATPWHDKAWVLLPVLGLLLAMLVWVAWPLNEDTMRQRAEKLLDEGTRSSMSQARISYLELMVRQYPEGEHAAWASEQIDRVEMLEAEHALTVKLNRNLPLKNEAERLCAEAMRFEKFGDNATAVDKYQSLITLLGDESDADNSKFDDYRPLVNLARNKIARISAADTDQSEAARIISAKIEEADQLYLQGRTIAAKKIWYSIVELYASNAAVAPLVKTAQDRLAETSAGGAARADQREPLQ
ncbi:serine/threonine-protein kinase [Rhodopirellula sp. SWK7]|uniref:serine/threonine-protein kinase n=1 Tax=Rhodopirellula sp. SWK7 TaxID=595460 RepID=UPI0002BD92C8|nr:serine/threonine-protein kinase [Rhodopirellula sp. SWK7]EMI43812.1 Serine/threonine protein kinase-related protein [Rhodopirellula sp. SWK7]